MSREERRSSVLIIAEGEDEEGLVKALIKHLQLPDCDVINAEGRGNLKDRTTAAMKIPGPPIGALAIVRDAESDAKGAATSTQNILVAAGFEAPDAPFQICRSAKGTCGYAVLPDGVRSGSIEDLCLEATSDQRVTGCIDSFFHCLVKSGAKNHKSESVERKARVQAYLAGCATDRVVHRAGLGFLKGHFDLDSVCLLPMHSFLTALCRNRAV